ncbi:MAG: nucleotide exchange factor GrpE [Clostridia bacterium]|nr:nucleotide exchange factor GrpE [Clostridia bacterium]
MAKEKKAKVNEAEETEAKVEEVKEPTNEEKLQAELNETKDQLLRMAAEYDNFRKRSQREKESLYSECKSSVVNDLLPVIDNFERCVAPADDTSYEDYKKGVELTYKQFGEALKKLGIEAFGEVGEAFDPNLHNAVMHTEDENLPENSISNVLMKGYKLGDKIIRAAMVAVAN